MARRSVDAHLELSASSRHCVRLPEKKSIRGEQQAMQSNKTIKPARTLTKFHLFSKLPIELRPMIYKLASQHSRIIALVFIHNLEDLAAISANPESGDWIHRTVRVCPESRQPALMQVHQESRRACRPLYQSVVMCDSVTQDIHNVYLNPSTDILYFGGDNICLNEIESMLFATSLAGLNLSRVAIDISGMESVCCTDYNRPVMHSRAGDTIYRFHGIQATTSNGQAAYHRFDSLTEVSLVVGSELTHLQPRAANSSTLFRPAITSGATFDSVRLTSELDVMVKDIRNRVPVGPSGYTWTGDSKSTFNFISFAPSRSLTNGRAGEVFEIMAAPGFAVGCMRLTNTSGSRKIVDQMERKHKCRIIIPDVPGFLDLPAEIAIEGTKCDVLRCKQALEKEIIRIENDYWCMKHPWQACSFLIVSLVRVTLERLAGLWSVR